ncbi:hypothetical protein Patl1_21098 [Pistacia atlantica]|uniref:Uncharacterized protein n=1 Tax=Pistacia atlantica TaxID=434234 RepID=A0ACC1BNN5_9ROSI|nr:hypothetical protein Patl1_21098 [Pistacia atlantica]
MVGGKYSESPRCPPTSDFNIEEAPLTIYAAASSRDLLFSPNLLSCRLKPVLPHGLNCLQRSFPCNQGSPILYGNLYGTYLDKWLYWYADSSFTVNWGGPQFTSSDKIVYEMEDETLGPARYYVTGTNRWGVSNVGYSIGANVPLQFKISSESQFTNTVDSKLFQTARDFDITRVAGGVPRRAVKREYTAWVSENYLEIHLFWAGKGTCCLPYVVFFIVRRRRPQADDDALLGMDVRLYTFSYDELSTATEGFNPANKLGEGGFGQVYKVK